MKTLALTLGLAAAAMMVASCSPAPKEQKALVIYYSQTSNTETVAQEIASRLNADIEEIVSAEPYDGDFQATIERCMKEREQGITPDILPITADLAKYDVIFLGYPIWFGTYAPPMKAFLSQVDLSGKKVVPFCTFGSGGLESSIKGLAEAQPNAEILPGYGVRAARMDAVCDEVDRFLKAGGFIEGEYVQSEEFPEQHEVSEEEAEIFNAAVGDYPMIHAQAKTVAAREVPDGTEYLFTAVDLPREEGSKMPPAGEMRVYVLVKNGEEPVFTRVVRN